MSQKGQVEVRMKAQVKADELGALGPNCVLPSRCTKSDIFHLVKARLLLFEWEYKK